MMFEDLHRLYDSLVAYRENREYKFNQAKVKLDYWAEDKAFKMENESLKKDFRAIKSELNLIDAPKFY